jgi:hypothetical protein
MAKHRRKKAISNDPLENVIEVFDTPDPPRLIWQKPFDYDPGHYQRLCLGGDGLPTISDLCDYSLDLQYMEIQPNLFRYLFPVVLRIWRKALFRELSVQEYGGFYEQFCYALAKRPFLEEMLEDYEYEAVEEFFRLTLLERIRRENTLDISGKAVYDWFRALGTFAESFNTLEKLWEEWWKFTEAGYTIAGLEYLSSLLYEDNANPIFQPWTKCGGGGPPLLWESAGILEVPWRPANVSFLTSTLTLEYIEAKLKTAAGFLKDKIESDIPAKMVEDFPLQSILLVERLPVLPDHLAKPDSKRYEW